MTVNECIIAALSTWGDYPCLIERDPYQGDRFISARELQARIKGTAHNLRRWGVAERSLVPVFLENSCNFIICFLALLCLKAVPVMVKWEYRKIELDEVFRVVRAQVIVAESSHLPILKPYLSGKVVVVNRSGKIRLLQSSRTKSAPGSADENIASVNFTYRGCGYPLGAAVSHDQYLHGAKVLQQGLLAKRGSKMLIILPMSHIFTLIGCILVPCIYGLTGVITRSIHPRLLFTCIRDFSIEHVTSVPQIYSLMCRVHDESLDLSCLQTFVSGGSVLTEEAFIAIKQCFKVDVLHGYGLTECTPVSRNVRGQAQPGTIGPVCDGIECSIASAEHGNSGEILVRTPYLSKAYLGRDKETRDAFHEGWFKTGDRGYFRGEHLVFVEEIKETRKINGNIVDLEEVRNTILLDDQISAVDVQYRDNSLTALCAVSKKIDFDGKVRELRTALRSLLAEYKIPKRFVRM